MKIMQFAAISGIIGALGLWPGRGLVHAAAQAESGIG